MTSKNKFIKEQMNIVIVGHVDHGKSTVIGRLLADTNSLPEGKLEEVKSRCKSSSRPFEYAFLLDALKDEQSQGITIDSARCFFNTEKRYYIVFDAPGHIEFLKNMVTGAAHAEAALLVIDANEGIQENSRRHGFLLAMLGIKQISILVNKMDLVNYSEDVFNNIVGEYKKFLASLNVEPISFIPISAREGDGLVGLSDDMSWYKEKTVLAQLDAFQKRPEVSNLPFRFPVQDIYKFTLSNDDRRIIAGTVETGTICVEDEVVFLPSYKKSRIKTVEEFNTDIKKQAIAGQAIGFTLDSQVYIKPGEIMVKASEVFAQVSSRFKANIFWMGKAPFIMGKTYKLKLATMRINAKLVSIEKVIDASELTSLSKKEQIDRHDVAEVILETDKPIAFDLIADFEGTGRFVLVDHYEIAGGGIILEKLSDKQTTFDQHIKERESVWERGLVDGKERSAMNKHKPKFVVLCGPVNMGKINIAKALERKLFEDRHQVYYLGISNVLHGLVSDYAATHGDRSEHIRRLGALAHIMTDSGKIFITTISDLDDYDIEKLKKLNAPNEILVVHIGKKTFSRYCPDLQLDSNENIPKTIDRIYQFLQKQEIIEMEYYI